MMPRRQRKTTLYILSYFFCASRLQVAALETELMVTPEGSIVDISVTGRGDDQRASSCTTAVIGISSMRLGNRGWERTPSSPFLIHYAMTTFSTSNWFPRLYFVFGTTI